MSNPKQIVSLKSQSAWLLFAKFVGYVFAFVFPLLVVRYLTKEEVGAYRFIFQVIGNVAGILPLGFSLSAYYFLSRSAENRSRTILNILIFNFVMGGLGFLVFYLFPDLLAQFFEDEQNALTLAPLAGIVIWLWVFGVFLEIVAIANQEPKIATAFIILSQLTKTLLMICGVMVFGSVESLLYAVIVQLSLQILVLIFYLISRFPRFWTSFDKTFFKAQLAYALPFGFAGILWVIQMDIHNYFVFYRFGEIGYAVYAYGCFEVPLITMLFEAVSSVLIPKMSQLQSQGNRQKIIELTATAMNKIALAFLPLFVFLMIVADIFIVTLFTDEYAGAIPIFRINLLLLPIYIILIDPLSRAYEEIGRFLLKFRIILLIGIIASLWFGIQYFEMTGMISIVVISVIFERIVTLLKIRKLLDLELSHIYLLKNLGKTAIAAFVAGFFLLLFYLFTSDSLFQYCVSLSENLLAWADIGKFKGFFGGSLYLGMCLAVFLPVYVFLANMFELIEDDEKEMLRNLLEKLWIFKKMA